jgi:hypothetical protein
MFNDYELFESIKFRQQEIEKKARSAWKDHSNTVERTEMKVIKPLTNKQVPTTICHQCA